MIRVLRWMALVGVGVLIGAALASGGTAPEEHPVDDAVDPHVDEVIREATSVFRGIKYPGDVNDLHWWADIVDWLISEIYNLSDQLGWYRNMEENDRE